MTCQTLVNNYELRRRCGEEWVADVPIDASVWSTNILTKTYAIEKVPPQMLVIRGFLDFIRVLLVMVGAYSDV